MELSRQYLTSAVAATITNRINAWAREAEIRPVPVAAGDRQVTPTKTKNITPNSSANNGRIKWAKQQAGSASEGGQTGQSSNSFPVSFIAV